jgi:hypothetical protein
MEKHEIILCIPIQDVRQSDLCWYKAYFIHCAMLSGHWMELRDDLMEQDLFRLRTARANELSHEFRDSQTVCMHCPAFWEDSVNRGKLEQRCM